MRGFLPMHIICIVISVVYITLNEIHFNSCDPVCKFSVTSNADKSWLLIDNQADVHQRNAANNKNISRSNVCDQQFKDIQPNQFDTPL